MRDDELNRLKDVIYPGGKRIDYTYDEVGNLKKPSSPVLGSSLMTMTPTIVFRE